jgi:hypothetical protein
MLFLFVVINPSEHIGEFKDYLLESLLSAPLMVAAKFLTWPVIITQACGKSV